jgi:hypothetical protein
MERMHKVCRKLRDRRFFTTEHTEHTERKTEKNATGKNETGEVRRSQR